MRALSAAVSVVALGVVVGFAVRHANLQEAPASASAPASAKEDPRLAYGHLPLAFVPNQGQSNPEVKFVARSPLGTAFLTATGPVFALKSDGPSRSFAMHLQGARPNSEMIGEQPMPGKVNELLGNDPSKWRTNIPTFASVRYREVYPGIDLVFHGSPQRMEYDLEVAAGADPNVIRIQYEGAEDVRIDASGDLVISVGGREVRQGRPVVYQSIDGERREVSGAYLMRGTEVAFALEGYDARHAVVIDPVLEYSTYLGGTGSDNIRGVAVDSAGAAYLTGSTTSTNFPVSGAVQASSGGGSDAFIVKVGPTGALVYATYLGGSSDDEGRAIAVDSAGSAYVTGVTGNLSVAGPNNFPTQPSQSAPGYQDVFVTKLSANGASLTYSTLLGGPTQNEDGDAIAVDSAGNAWVAGNTYSFRNNFPFPINPPRLDNAGNGDGFLARFNAAGAEVYFTFLGGSREDYLTGLAVDSAGNAYLVGSTLSSDFPLSNAWQPTFNGNRSLFINDAFVTRINADAGFGYSTFLGGTGSEQTNAVAVDSAGSAYVTGYTTSNNFPTQNAVQPASAGGWDVIVSKFLADGGLSYSTYLGGTGYEQAYAIAVDGTGNAYLTGYTQSSDFPTANPLQAAIGGSDDAFVSKLGPAGSSLLYSTFLGGAGTSEQGNAIALDSAKNVYVAGQTDSQDFSTVNAVQTSNAGGGDGFLAKLDLASPLLSSVTPNFGSTAGGTAVTLTGSQFASGITLTWGGSSRPVTFVNATTLTTTTPAHAAGPVNIVVTNSDGRTASLSAGFLYVPSPVVSSVSPSAGPASGGTSVTISGSAFAAGATVSIGGIPATNVTVINSTTITATTPAQSAGSVDVVVTNPPGVSGSKTNAFTYNPPPTVTNIAAAVGPASGGTTVDVLGANFVNGATVTLGGAVATNVVVISATRINLKTPAHAAGAVDVVVTNPDGQTGTLTSGFTYEPPPAVGNVMPYFGTTAGGTSVAVHGSDFKSGAQVTFGGVAATAVTFVNDTLLSVTSPAHAVGAVDVVVTNLDGQWDTNFGGFEYVVPPVVTQVSPAVGPVTGSTPVSITGSGFVTGTSVKFGTVFATNVVVVDSTHLNAQTPAHAAGAVDVVAVSPPGLSGPPLTAGFTFLDAPTVTSVSPSTGSGTGGTAVTITGTNFFAGAVVYFGAAPATSIVVVDSSTITAVTPAHAAGPVDVLVRNPDTQSGQLAAAFSYDALAPAVQAVSPNTGPIAGGTVITVSGSSFVAGATVTLDGVSATNVAVQSDTVIQATVPAHASGAVAVRVTNPDSQFGELANGFTYLSPPSVASLSPATGPIAGGTSVTLSGADFQSGATVLFGGSLATVTSLDTATLIVTSPAHAAGTVDVVVKNPDGQQSAAESFVYVAPPAIASLSPNIGPTAGGTTVTVTGSGFVDGATLKFGGEPAKQLTVVDASTITAVAPAHAAGRVDVVIQNPDGQSGTAALGYEYSDACVTCKAKVSEYAFGCSAGSGELALGWLLALSWPALRRRRRERVS